MTTKSYIFAHSSKLGSHDEIKNFLTKSRYVSTWRREINNVYFILSSYSASEISERIHRRFEERGATFIVSEFSDNSQGWLSERAWELLEHKNERLEKKKA